MDIVQENRELISPKTSDRVSGTQALLQPSRYGDEKFIPNQVSEAVVDDLEAIDVQEENCVEIISRAFCASDCKLQTVAEQGPVGETSTHHETHRGAAVLRSACDRRYPSGTRPCDRPYRPHPEWQSLDSAPNGRSRPCATSDVHLQSGGYALQDVQRSPPLHHGCPQDALGETILWDYFRPR